MTRTTAKRVSASALVLAGVFVVVDAGELEPPVPPAPTMVTLQQIYDKLDECAGTCEVPTTGQTGCWNASGNAVSCAGTGQDGEYQAGRSVNPRFTDNNDGTVTDNLTNLIWLKDASCFGLADWETASSNANMLASGSCGLTDGSVAGDWRIPNIREVESLTDYDELDPGLPSGHPFSNVQVGTYLSSTTFAPDMTQELVVARSQGSIVKQLPKSGQQYMWPVRSGQ